MKVLILCDFFEPVRIMGANRPTEFAKCFKKLGYEVDVVTLWNEVTPHDDNFSFPSVTRIDISKDKRFRRFNRLNKFLRKVEGKAGGKPSADTSAAPTKKPSGFKTKIKNIIKYFGVRFENKLRIIYGKAGSKAMYSVCKDHLDEYDFVYTTFGDFSPVLCGEIIKKKHPNVKVISEFRDAVYYKMFIKGHKRFYKYFIYKHCKLSDIIIFCSQGYLDDSILPKNYGGKIAIIENGFMEYVESPKDLGDKLSFLYSGSYFKARHLYSLLDSIKKLEEENGELKIKLQFCGDEKSYANYINEVRSYGLEKYVSYLGYLSKKDLLESEKNAHVLLISSWNYKDMTGVLPGKLFEYFSFKKPVLGHVTGDCPNSLIKGMINDHDVGFCSDDLTEGDYKKMYDYVEKLYSEFLKTGHLSYKGNPTYTDNFLRIKQVQTMIDMVNELK